MDAPKIGLYLRLSRDDERVGESMSIENQRSYLLQYLASRGWEAEECYIDDGYTGTNFDRPGFQRLLSDIDCGRIQVVVTKDLSRLGRDQIGTAYYYQIYFPKNHVRYIAVAEGLDTSQSGGTNALFPFLTAANDFYTADISRKVRSALTTRKKEGKFIGATPPLGYQRNPTQRGQLMVNPELSPIVEQVFGRYLTSGSVIGVAKTLTEDGVPTPSQCKGGGVTQKRYQGVWSDTMVRRILTNPTYAGHLTQNRGEKVNYKVATRTIFPKERWITIENTHEPIVSQEDFQRVQEMLAVRGYSRGDSTKSKPHLLTGLAFCADCGAPMTYVRENEQRTYMVCQGYRRGGRLHLCTSHSIREDAVVEEIRKTFRGLSQRLDVDALKEGLQQEQAGTVPERQLKTAQTKLSQLDIVLERLYQDRASGILREDEFGTLLASNRAARTQWQGSLAQTQRMVDERATQRDTTAQIRGFLTFEHLDRPTVTALLERILIHQDKTIELICSFCHPS